jgi:predicted RNA-binding Zn-ribbon protein involved in translation (DUF1610 family)
MAMTTTGSTVVCAACGAEIPPEARANFCPACGIPLTLAAEETAEARRSTNRWFVALAAILVAGMVALGLVVGRLLLSAGDGEDGSAAEAMDRFAPIAEDWVEQRDDIDDEAETGDPDGVAVAVDDAEAWTDVAVEDVADIAADVEGESAAEYQQLVTVFDGRLEALDGLQDADGDTTSPAWATGQTELDGLGAESDGLICEIAEVIDDEGDDPDDHITLGMQVDC